MVFRGEAVGLASVAAAETGGQRHRGPLKVCFLAACPFPANHGSPGAVREMAEAITEIGHQVHIVTYHMGENISVKGPQVHRIRPLTRETSVVVGPTVRRPLYDLQMVFEGLQVIRRLRPHLLHAHSYEAALIGWILQLETGLPVFFSSHSTMADELASYDFIRPRCVADCLAKLLDAFVPRMVTRLFPHSTNLEKFYFRRGLGARTEPLVKFGIDFQRMAQGNRSSVRQRYGFGSEPVILYTGVMDQFQRLDLLLEALSHLLIYEPTVKLLIVATIPNEKHLAILRRRTEELGIVENVVVTEPQPLESIPDFLSACDVAVVPRPHCTGFPIKLLNYMAAGKPCILFASSASQGLHHRENVFLAASDTSSALGEAILEVLRDKELRNRISRNGYHFVRHHHDRRLIAQQVCAGYYQTLEARGRRVLKSRDFVAFPGEGFSSSQGDNVPGENGERFLPSSLVHRSLVDTSTIEFDLALADAAILDAEAGFHLAKLIPQEDPMANVAPSGRCLARSEKREPSGELLSTTVG